MIAQLYERILRCASADSSPSPEAVLLNARPEPDFKQRSNWIAIRSSSNSMTTWRVYGRREG